MQKLFCIHTSPEKEKLEINYASDGSSFGIYSNVEIPYIHMPSGSLGHGLGVAIGLALAQPEGLLQPKNICCFRRWRMF